MRVLGNEDIERLLPMADCIAAVEEAFRSQADAVLPPAVLGLHLPGGGIHIKAAGLAGGRPYVAVKLNANFPANPRHGLPTIQGFVALLDAECGCVLALMDSIEITARRTAAATALAAKHLAKKNSRALALIGCGVQAAFHVEALLDVAPIESVAFCDPRDAAVSAAGGSAAGCE